MWRALATAKRNAVLGGVSFAKGVSSICGLTTVNGKRRRSNNSRRYGEDEPRMSCGLDCDVDGEFFNENLCYNSFNFYHRYYLRL